MTNMQWKRPSFLEKNPHARSADFRSVPLYAKATSLQDSRAQDFTEGLTKTSIDSLESVLLDLKKKQVAQSTKGFPKKPSTASAFDLKNLEKTKEDELFKEIIDTSSIKLYPSQAYPRKSTTLKEFVKKYLNIRNSQVPFIFKLYNVLQLTTLNDEFKTILGIDWADGEGLIAIDSQKLSKIIGFGSNPSALTGKMGALEIHGFKEVSKNDISQEILNKTQLFNHSQVQFYKHITQHFHRGATEIELARCRNLSI